MASDKTRALLSFGRFLVALLLGYGIYAVWMETRPDDPWFYSYGAAAIAIIMAFALLSKLKGGD